MWLTFHSPRGSVEQRWTHCALLRDNVQHHLEGGKPSREFECLHTIGEAPAQRVVSVLARQLRAELERARQGLAGIPAASLAVSRGTLAVQWPPPAAQETELAGAHARSLPFSDRPGATLGELFGPLLDRLLRITEGTSATDEVVVINL